MVCNLVALGKHIYVNFYQRFFPLFLLSFSVMEDYVYFYWLLLNIISLWLTH